MRGHENPDNLNELLSKIAAEVSFVDIIPVDSPRVEKGPDLGGQEFGLLVPPRIAIASQWPLSAYSFGSVWYLLDKKIQARTSIINIQLLSEIDLRRYNVLILPSGDKLGAVLDKEMLKSLKRWVEEGGTLIALENSAAFLAGEDIGLTTVQLRRNALDQLGVYDEAVRRERAALNIQIDSEMIWSGSSSRGVVVDLLDQFDAGADDLGKLKRDDDWLRRFGPSGAFVKGEINPEHWLGFGLPGQLPVRFTGNNVLMSKAPVATPVRLSKNDGLRLSGLLWPEARERMANSAYVTVEKVGKGQVTLFACDPTFRAWLPGHERLLLNAAILGPGLGATPPARW